MSNYNLTKLIMVLSTYIYNSVFILKHEYKQHLEQIDFVCLFDINCFRGLISVVLLVG